MIGLRIFIFFTLLKAHFLYSFGLRSGNKKLYYSALHLFSKQSFRLPESAKHDLLIIPKTWLFVIKTLFRTTPEVRMLGEGHAATFDSSFSAIKERTAYLHFFNISTGSFYSREQLLGSFSAFSSLLNLFLVSLLAALLLPFSFSKHRANYALLLREIFEWINLISLLKKNKVVHLYFFSIYEKDANFLTILLSAYHIKVSKITSEVPLTFANKIIVADEVCLCFAYQQEEAETYKDTIFCDSFKVWIPEMTLAYADLYTNKQLVLPKYSIGFYSGACWLRKKLNHSLAGIGSYDVEEELLKHVIEYIKLHPEYTLLFFLHPLEKRNPDDTKLYYNRLIGNRLLGRIRFSEKEIPSTHLFDTINIGVSLFSTIMFERLSLGLKCILCPFDKTDFPIAGSPFRNVCAYNKEQLLAMLDANIPLSPGDYFLHNGIGAYRTPHIRLNCELG